MARLAEQRLGFVPGQRLAEQLVLAAGNPLYTRELLDALVRSGGLRSPSGAAGPIELVAEQPREAVLSLSLAIADRLDFLTDGARDTLRLTALLGRSFAAQDVSLVTGLAPERLRGVLEEAVAAGVLERDGERLRFRHGLLRQVLYETVPAPIRAAHIAPAGHPGPDRRLGADRAHRRTHSAGAGRGHRLGARLDRGARAAAAGRRSRVP